MSTPADRAVDQRIRAAFERQHFMAHLGARLLLVEEGVVEIAVSRREQLLQQHGFLHAGVLTSLLDSACGFAALSRMDAASGVLSVEFKVNLLAPAAGEQFVVRGEVLKAGRSVVVCRGDAFAVNGDARRLIAAMQATMMTVRDRDDVKD
ncbi:MAG: PaaI family thioesterase [Gemmatimonadaceae bacterium]